MWYVHKNGEQLGPYNEAELQQFKGSDVLVWQEGMENWVEIATVFDTKSQPAKSREGMLSDEIDYKIYGDNVPILAVELDPNEAVVAESGSMYRKEICIDMQVTTNTDKDSGLGAKALSMGKRFLTGESLFMTKFSNTGNAKSSVMFSAPYTGSIIPVDLHELGGTLICQKGSFMCGANGTDLTVHFSKKIGRGLFGGEGFIMQKITGDGLCFIHAGGSIEKLELKAGEKIHVDSGCIVALEQSVNFDVEYVGSVKSVLFSGEGLVFSTLEGPGQVWLQSMPFSRFANMVMANSAAGSIGESSAVSDVTGIVNSILK